MSRSLDMSLDDIIRKNNSSKSARRTSFGGGRGGNRDSASILGPGPDRRFAHRQPVRTQPYFVPPPLMTIPEAMMLQTGGFGGESRTKLYVSNLDYGVTNGDIKVLFSEVGELKRYSIHYDKSGRSKGTAEVIFEQEADALAAIKRYNGVNLDGKPMKIEVVGINIFPPTPLPLPEANILGNLDGTFGSSQQCIGSRAYTHGAPAQGRVSHGLTEGQREWTNRAEKKTKKKTAKELDAELDKYHMDAIKIN